MAPNTDRMMDIANEDLRTVSENNKSIPHRKQEIVWFFVLYFTYTSVAGAYGLYLGITSALWKTIAFTFVMQIISELGITAGAHRLWTHKAYKAKMPLQIFLMLCHSATNTHTTIKWVRDHLLHHKYTDTDADPHNSTRGFFYSHVGFILLTKTAECKAKGKALDLSELYANPVLRFQQRDDPILSERLQSCDITLVDHHVLSAADRHLAPLVSEIIDHRPLDRSHGGYREDTRTTIELVGSCATLVAQRIMDLSALFARDVDFFVANVACCDMLHSTIILDTVNCCKLVDKATPHDEEVLLFLENILKPADPAAERAHKLQSLVSARRAVSALSPARLLRKDAKTAGDLLVPSLPLLVKEFLSRPGSLAAVSAALGPGGAALLLGMELAGGLARDMAVYCTDEDKRDRLCAHLQAWRPALDLCEEQLPDRSSDQSGDRSLRYFAQRNLSASRKQYMPALLAFLEGKSSSS